MARIPTRKYDMCPVNLTILSYHRFGEETSDYPFSRTYLQFNHDLNTKDFDWITIDDGMKSILKACEMMRLKNIRAKLFISTALIGTPGYCDADDIWKLSRRHDIENHSHEHIRLTEVSEEEVRMNIKTASEWIHQVTGRRPRFFVPPWNTYNDLIAEIVQENNMQLVHSRIDIKNDSR
jgi:peptidoglycan/xylan/chitin deacetylase (PgdA/CDA1 family)